SAAGHCGPLPALALAEPPRESLQQGSFAVGSRVTYSCLQGLAKRPGMPDTTECLPTAQWSLLHEFCDHEYLAEPGPTRLSFAKLSEEDETKNFYAVGVTVSYICRAGYEKSSEGLLTSTCLENTTWTEVPELCQKKSCGVPAHPEHGKVVATDHLFGARASVVCDEG
ncbi:DAF factor, partial [Nothoprocta ornata]|nr:DAF factor [Nothoprocta pentlandii]NWY03299.1 DAF factor [Nothoprocta ornata]